MNEECSVNLNDHSQRDKFSQVWLTEDQASTLCFHLKLRSIHAFAEYSRVGFLLALMACLRNSKHIESLYFVKF